MKKLMEEGNKVLWIADRLELLKQSIERIGSMDRPRDITYQLLCSGMAVENEDGKQSQETRIAVEKISGIKPQADMLFASTQTDAKHGESEENENKFQGWLSEISDGKLYIIYDEAHHVGAETVQKFFGELLGTGGQTGMVERFGLVGLTATVYRMDSSAQSFNKWFKNGWENGKVVIGSEKPYGQGESEYVNNRIEIVSIKDLIEEGILKKPDIIRVDDFKDGMPEDEVAYLADRIQKKYKGWGKTIVFVRSIKMANDLEQKLVGRNVQCFAYTHENPDLKKLKEFRESGSKGMMITVYGI